MRGLTRSIMRLIIPPLPAASRPSKMITMRALVALTQSCSLTSSTCSLKTSASYSFLPIFDWPFTPERLVSLSSLGLDSLLFLDFLLIVLSGFLGIGRLSGACIFCGREYAPSPAFEILRLRRQYVGHSACLRAQQLGWNGADSCAQIGADMLGH